MSEAHKHWRVEVSTSGEQIVAIETGILSGRELSEADIETILDCSEHLWAFAGGQSRRPVLTGETPEVVRDALIVMRDNARTATERNMAERALAALTQTEKWSE